MSKYWIITNDERSFYGPMHCEVINKCEKDIGGVIILPPMVGKNNFHAFINEVKYFIGFLGVKGFLYATYLWGKSFFFGYGSVKKCSEKHDIKTFNVDDLDSCKYILLENKPLLIIATVDVLVNKELLNMSKMGWVNIHCGPVPKYAGLNAPFWCMYNNEKHLSVSIHIMDETFDSGSLLKQEHILNDGTPYFTQLTKLLSIASRALIYIINNTSESFDAAWTPDKSKRSYFPKPDTKVGKEFRKRGGRFI